MSRPTEVPIRDVKTLVAGLLGRTGGRVKRSRSGRNSQHSLRGQTRVSKSGKNPTVEFIKVVLGGLMAIPIAYAIVLWAFNKDPLNVGPQISEYVPFVVPADFQVDLKSGFNAED